MALSSLCSSSLPHLHLRFGTRSSTARIDLSLPPTHAAPPFCCHDLLRDVAMQTAVAKPSVSRRSRIRAQVSLSEIAPTAAAVYGSLLLGGGLFAYSRSSSKGSLYGGLTGAALMGLVYSLATTPGKEGFGEAIGFGAGLLFVAVFGIRLAATKKLVPAAPLLLTSLAATAIFLGAYMQDKA